MSTVQDELSQVALAENYAMCIAATLLIFDYVLTVREEIKCIWKAPWSLGKLVFLFVRYIAWVGVGCTLFVKFATSVTRRSCEVVWDWILTSTVCIYGSATLILALRTWAIWDRNWLVAVIVGTTWAGLVGAGLFFLVEDKIGLDSNGDAAFPEISGCEEINTPTVFASALHSYIVLASYEGVIITLTVARGLQHLYKPSSLISVLYRDAVIASTGLLGLTIVNAVMASKVSNWYYLGYILSVPSIRSPLAGSYSISASLHLPTTLTSLSTTPPDQSALRCKSFKMGVRCEIGRKMNGPPDLSFDIGSMGSRLKNASMTRIRTPFGGVIPLPHESIRDWRQLRRQERWCRASGSSLPSKTHPRRQPWLWPLTLHLAHCHYNLARPIALSQHS